MSKYKLSDTMGISVEEADEIIKRFFRVVPKVEKLLNNLGNFAKTKGFIKTDPVYQRIRWFENWENAYRANDNKVLSSIERAGKNTPIQGTNANIVKEAMVNIQRIIDENNYPAYIILQVYDEIQTIVKEDFAEEWNTILQKEMVNAAKNVIKTIPVIVDCKITDYWQK